MLPWNSDLIITSLTAIIAITHGFDIVQFSHKGCFKDQREKPDLPFKAPRNTTKDVKTCVDFCTAKYFIYAGLKNGEFCYCGNSYGRYGPSDKCRTRCSGSFQEVCGGPDSSNVYYTNVKVPGPPTDLKLVKSNEKSLKIQWSPPEYALEDFVVEYTIQVEVNDSFDISHNSRTFSPKIIYMTQFSRMTTILGLKPASKYNVTVRADSKDGPGEAVQAFFWTEISDPVEPQPPKLIQHDHDHHGEIHVQLHGLRLNRFGPIDKYQVLVIDETNPAPFDKKRAFDYTNAMNLGLSYWIAAEFPKDIFTRDVENIEFVVGDNRTYGAYFNFGPLPEKRDFHVTLGVVSTWQGVTKVTYAKVSHDQHAMENIVVFNFHGEQHDHDHDHDEKHSHKTNHHNHPPDQLSLVMIIIITIMGIILALALIGYGYLRFTTHRRKGQRGSQGDVQELTTHVSSINMAFDNDSVEDSLSKMDSIRAKVWNIPVNFLDLSHEVIGRGRFGSVVKGQVNRYGRMEHVNIQVVPGKILEESEVEVLAKDLDSVLKYGTHSNLINFIGICEDKDTIFAVFEQAWPSLKQALLDSRSLVHYPDLAEANGKFSTFHEEQLLKIMLEISQGMDHMAKSGLHHKKLCARNIYLTHNNQPKIGAMGIIDYISNGVDPDLTRWTAPEAYKGSNFVWKCDVWSLAVVFWEILTLGGTPYAEVLTKEVPFRVMRGSRLGQPDYVSEELYQLLITCWQVDLDERPTFEEIGDYIKSLLNHSANSGQYPVNFYTTRHFTYENYSVDLEIV